VTVPLPSTAPAVGAPASAPKLSVRPTTPSDLPAVVSLLSQRDGHALDPAHVSTALYGLDPAHLAAWIAFADDRPAGLTCLYARTQHWGSRDIRAGYWAHLFVPEEFRRLMVYPQLVLAMFRGIKPLGIDGIFTGTRRAHVAEGHVKLGFAKLGEYRVLYKPLRPFRLLSRYKNWPGLVRAAAAPGDALYGAYLAMRSGSAAGLTFHESAPEGPALAGLSSLLNQARAGLVSQAWTADSLRRRVTGTIDGFQYRILLAERSGRPVAAAVYRLAERERVSAGILMELVTAPDAADAAPALLSHAERRLRAIGADTTLYLDGLGPDTARLLRSAGHRTSTETYQMLVWPKALVPAGSPAADLSRWRFSFLDHDAF
jgi:hypothetical protein